MTTDDLIKHAMWEAAFGKTAVMSGRIASSAARAIRSGIPTAKSSRPSQSLGMLDRIRNALRPVNNDYVRRPRLVGQSGGTFSIS